MISDAQKWKEKGNEAFKQKRYNSAIDSYTRSLELRKDPLVFGNRAQAQINAGLWILAQMDCSAAIDMDKKLAKNFYRRAQALKQLGLYEEAYKDIQECLKLTSDSAASSMLESLKGMKNARVIEVQPVERDEYLACDEKFVDIPILCEGIVEDLATTSISRSEKAVNKTVPRQPVSFADFASSVNYLCDDPIMLTQYFLQIPTSQFSIFDDLIDDHIASLLFKSILIYLETNGNSKASEIAEKMLKLTDVSRFDVIILLMGSGDKNVISKICSFLSPSDSSLIMEKYF